MPRGEDVAIGSSLALELVLHRIVMFYRYLEDQDVHLLDCAGKVDAATGFARLRRLSEELKSRRARDGVHRLLIDFRHTIWESEDTHRQLSRAVRGDFGLNAENPAVRLAFVFNGGTGTVSNTERWFEDEFEAMAWLIREPTVGDE